MNVRSLLFLILCCFFPIAVYAQGFAGLGRNIEGNFQTPQKGTSFDFPTDHGPHPDFRIEWWYLTANLQDENGLDLGVQWTLFRSAAHPSERNDWQSPQYWLAHAAVTTPTAHSFSEKLSRGGIGQAGVTSAPFAAWIDDWQLTSGDDTLKTLSLHAHGDQFSYDLTLTTDGPLVFHGEDGYSVKSEAGQASYYYSQPHYAVTGTVTQAGRRYVVTGTAWLDREWSSQPLASDQSGWDWFSLNFDNGNKLMGFVLRGANGDYTSGSWINADGTVTRLPAGAFRAIPTAYRSDISDDIPTTWRVTLPKYAVDVTVTAINPNAWMATSFSYWEGPVRIGGTHRGRGYLEMTGYDQALP